jgi:hypothetical protein
VPRSNEDFLNFFQNEYESEWDDVAHHLDVFEFSSQFFDAAPPAVVQQVVQTLASHHIALAIAAGFVCGSGGVTPQNTLAIVQNAEQAVTKIQNAGGTIDNISMDEPLWWDHYAPVAAASAVNGGCNITTIKGTAERAASVVNIYTEAFPNVIIRDTEPFPAISS